MEDINGPERVMIGAAPDGHPRLRCLHPLLMNKLEQQRLFGFHDYMEAYCGQSRTIDGIVVNRSQTHTAMPSIFQRDIERDLAISSPWLTRNLIDRCQSYHQWPLETKG